MTWAVIFFIGFADIYKLFEFTAALLLVRSFDSESGPGIKYPPLFYPSVLSK